MTILLVTKDNPMHIQVIKCHRLFFNKEDFKGSDADGVVVVAKQLDEVIDLQVLQGDN